MEIDWTIVLAQIGNFLLLMWLLKRFLYQPVRRLIDEREERVQKQLQDAQETKERAVAAEEEYRQALRRLKEEEAGILRAARQEAEDVRRQMLSQAIVEVNEEKKQLLAAWEEEQEALRYEMQERLVRSACQTAGSILQDLSQVNLEDALIGVLEARLDARQDAPVEASATSEALYDRVTIRTSFEPTSAQRVRLNRLAQRLVPEHRGEATPVFVVDPGLVFGIELIGGGQAISWSARDHLSATQELALDRLVQQSVSTVREAVGGD